MIQNKFWFGFLLPILVLLEGLFVDPFFSIVANDDTFPILQLFALFFIFLIKKPFNLSYSYLIIILSSILILFVPLSVHPSISILFVILVAMFLAMFALDQDGKFFYGYVLAFIVLSFLIFSYRYFLYSDDFYRLRSGVNIFGGSSVVHLILMKIVFDIFYYKRLSIYLVVSCLFISILYMNRLAILGNIILLFFGFFFFTKAQKIVVFTFFSVILITILNFNLLFFDILFARFSGLTEFFSASTDISLNKLSSDRYLLFDSSYNYFIDHPFGSGYKIVNHIDSLGYNSAHNLFLNAAIENGVFLLFFLVFAFFSFFIILLLKFFKYQSGIFLYGALVVSILIMNITFTGERLIQTTGYVSSFFLLSFYQLLRVSWFGKKLI